MAMTPMRAALCVAVILLQVPFLDAQDSPPSPSADLGGSLSFLPPGKSGNHALHFDADKRQEVYVGLVQATGDRYTAEAWIRLSRSVGPAETADIVGQHAASRDAKGTIDIIDNKLRFLLNTPEHRDLRSSAAVPVGIWTHVAGVYDGQMMALFINGIEVGHLADEGMIIPTNERRSTRIGGYAGTSTEPFWFPGEIDEVRIWEVARTQQELQADMYHEISPSQPGLIGYWRFDEGEGLTTADLSGNGHTGILTNYQGEGAPTWVPGVVALAGDSVTPNGAETDSTLPAVPDTLIATVPPDILPLPAPDTAAVVSPPDTATTHPGAIALDFDLAEGDQGKVLFEGAHPGRIADLELYAHDLPQISGWSAVLVYDPRQLRFVPGSFQPGPFLPGMVSLSDDKTGQVEVGGAVLGSGTKRAGSGALGVVSFEVLPGFETEAILTLTQFKLRQADGKVVSDKMQVAVRFAAGPPNTAPPIISLDFDLSPGNQDLRLAAQAEPVYTLQLHIADAPVITGWSAAIEYDPRQVRYQPGSFLPADFLPGLTPLVDDREGRLSVGGALLGSQSGNGGSGQLGQLAFAARDDFVGSAVLKVVEFTLRLASGERYRGFLRTAATIHHAPSNLVLDLDLAEGDQQRRSLSGVVAGSTYSMQLFLHRTPPIRGWGATLRYDAEGLRYVSGSFKASDFVPGLVSLVDEKEGQVSVGGSTLGTEGSGAGDGALGILEFEVLPGFSGTTRVEVVELSLRPLKGGVHKRVLNNAISLVGAPPPSLAFDFDLAEGDQEETFQEKVEIGRFYTVQLLIRDTPPISGWSAAIGYDPEQLRYVEDSFRPGDFIPGLVSLVSAKGDSVIIGGAVLGSTAQNSGQGTLGQLAFEVLPGFTGVTWLYVPGFSLRLAGGTVKREPATAEAFFYSGSGGATAVDSASPTLPAFTALLPGFPNPFNATTTLPYQLAQGGPVELEVFNLAGQQVRSLVDAFQPPGYYQVSWQGADNQGRPLASGVYLVRLQAGGIAQLQKSLLVR